MSKFYKVREKVFIKPLHKTGIILSINTTNKEVLVKYFIGEGQIEKKNFKLYELDKIKQPLEIKIKYFNDNIPKLEKISIGEWIDLRAADDVILKQFEFKLIPLGVAMELPKGYEANIVPRSSTFKNFGILQTNSFAVIDYSYRGDNDQWLMPVVALRDTEIKKGDRICQFRINRIMPKVKFIEVKELNNENRNGLGSTGTK